MRHTLFISDLHLCVSRPNVTQLFINWIHNISPKRCDALYILGDLFEYWAGDDALIADFHGPVLAALQRLSQSGVQVYFMHGNRDFLVGQEFSAQSGVKLLSDPSLVNLYGHPVLLTHGDALCTDDVAYMQFRQQVRQQDWQQQFLSQSVAQRNAFIQNARAKSEIEKANKTMAIMDVNEAAVIALLQAYQFPSYLVHGHTHRPNRHVHQSAGHVCERWVLGDWYEQGSYLMLTDDGKLTALVI